jgi:hypothetical protein
MLLLLFYPRSAAGDAGPAASAICFPSEHFREPQSLFPTQIFDFDLTDVLRASDNVRQTQSFHFNGPFESARPLGAVGNGRSSHSAIPTGLLAPPQTFVDAIGGRHTNADGDEAPIADEFTEDFCANAVFNVTDRFHESDDFAASGVLDETDVYFFRSSEDFDFSECFEATAAFAATGEFGTTECLTFSIASGRSELFVFSEGGRESDPWQGSEPLTASQPGPTVAPLPTNSPIFWESAAGIALLVFIALLGLGILGIAVCWIAKRVLARRRLRTRSSFNDEMRQILDQGLFLDLLDNKSQAGD